MAVYWIEGWTKKRIFRFTLDGDPLDLTGATVTLLLRDRDGVAVDTTGDVSIESPATAGEVGYKPDAADLAEAKSPYKARWKIQDALGDVIFLPCGPNGVNPDEWHVGNDLA